MRAEPFTLKDAERVLEHPDTPAAYVDWTEILPLTGMSDRAHLGNLLNWSHRLSRTPLGASRALFQRALGGIDEGLLDSWMTSLGVTPIEAFVDHQVPFLRNIATVQGAAREQWVATFLEAGGHRTPCLHSQPARRATPATPDSVILEITQSCNLACTMCSSRTGGFLPERTMPVTMFGELVRVLGPGAKSIRINGYGETTLVPQLDRYLDCLEEFRFTGLREIITNLSAPLEVYEDLVARNFVILASWDAARADVFESIRVGAHYLEYEARLRQLAARTVAAPERLGLLCTVQESNLDQVVPVVELAASAGAGLVIFNMVKEPNGSLWMSSRFAEIVAEFARADERAQAHGLRIRLPDHVGDRPLRLTSTHRSSGTFCDRPWREVLVRWDTEATVCNMFHPWTYGVLLPPGPARDVSDRFRRLWQGPNASTVRRHINRDSPHPYCQACYYLYA